MLELAERGKINHPIIMVFSFAISFPLSRCQLYLRYPARRPSYPAAVALRRSAVTPGSSAAKFHGSHVFADCADSADQVLGRGYIWKYHLMRPSTPFCHIWGFFCQSLSVCITSFLMQYLGSGVMETQLMLLFGTVWFVKLFCFM